MNKTKAGNTAVRLEAAKDLVHYLERDHRYSLNDSELETVVNLLLELSTDKNSAIRIQGIGGIKYYTSHHSGQMEGNLPLLENSITRFIEGSKDDEIRKKVMGGSDGYNRLPRERGPGIAEEPYDPPFGAYQV